MLRFIREIDAKDCLAALGLGLGCWAAYRIGGLNALIISGASICLTASGLTNIAILYTLAQVRNLSQAVRASKAE